MEELNKEDKQNNLNAEIRFSIKVVLNLNTLFSKTQDYHDHLQLKYTHFSIY